MPLYAPSLLQSHQYILTIRRELFRKYCISVSPSWAHTQADEVWRRDVKAIQNEYEHEHSSKSPDIVPISDVRSGRLPSQVAVPLPVDPITLPLEHPIAPPYFQSIAGISKDDKIHFPNGQDRRRSSYEDSYDTSQKKPNWDYTMDKGSPDLKGVYVNHPPANILWHRDSESAEPESSTKSEDFALQANKHKIGADPSYQPGDKYIEGTAVVGKLEGHDQVYYLDEQSTASAPRKRDVSATADAFTLERNELREQSAAAFKVSPVNDNVIHHPAGHIFRRERWPKPTMSDERPLTDADESYIPKVGEDVGTVGSVDGNDMNIKVEVIHQPANGIYHRKRSALSHFEEGRESSSRIFQSRGGMKRNEPSKTLLGTELVVHRPAHDLYRRNHGGRPIQSSDSSQIRTDMVHRLSHTPIISSETNQWNPKLTRRQANIEVTKAFPRHNPDSSINFVTEARSTVAKDVIDHSLGTRGEKDTISDMEEQKETAKKGLGVENGRTSKKSVTPQLTTQNVNSEVREGHEMGADHLVASHEDLKDKREAQPVPPPEFFYDHPWPFPVVLPSKDEGPSFGRLITPSVSEVTQQRDEAAFIDGIRTNLEEINNRCDDLEDLAHTSAAGVDEIDCQSKSQRTTEDHTKRQGGEIYERIPKDMKLSRLPASVQEPAPGVYAPYTQTKSKRDINDLAAALALNMGLVGADQSLRDIVDSTDDLTAPENVQSPQYEDNTNTALMDMEQDSIYARQKHETELETARIPDHDPAMLHASIYSVEEQGHLETNEGPEYAKPMVKVLERSNEIYPPQVKDRIVDIFPAWSRDEDNAAYQRFEPQPEYVDPLTVLKKPQVHDADLIQE